MKILLIFLPLMAMAQSSGKLTLNSSGPFTTTQKCDTPGATAWVTENQICIYNGKTKRGEWLKTPYIGPPPLGKNYRISISYGNAFGHGIEISEDKISLPEGMTEMEAILIMARSWAQSVDQSNQVFKDEHKRLTEGWQRAYEALKSCVDLTKKFPIPPSAFSKRSKDVL